MHITRLCDSVSRMEKNDSNRDTKPKVYEIGYLLLPTIAEEQVASEVQTIKAAIERVQGEFITEDFPKLRPLAYTMAKAVSGQRSKSDKAYFGWIKFETTSSHIPDIKSELDKNPNILRFIIINTVRENTLVAQKLTFKSPGDVGDKPKAADGSEPKISQEELDKTIDNLVVE